MNKLLPVLLMPALLWAQQPNSPESREHMQAGYDIDRGGLYSQRYCYDCLLPDLEWARTQPDAAYIDLLRRIQVRQRNGNYITETEHKQLRAIGLEAHTLMDLQTKLMNRDSQSLFAPLQPNPYGAALQPQTAQQMLKERTYHSLRQRQTIENILKEADQKVRNLQDVHKLINEAMQDLKTEQEKKQFADNIEQVSQWFYGAFGEMKAMIDQNQPDLLRAVWLSEAGLFDNPYAMSYDEFRAAIKSEAERVKRKVAGRDLTTYEWHNAIFNTLWEGQDGGPACRYDFDDPMGDHDLTKLMVCKLLKTRGGQCHSLPLFYKLVANELEVECWMAYLPNHSLIQIRDSTGTGKVYLELTNHRVLTDKNLLESGYVPVEGIHSGLYARPVDDREVITHCLSDLMVINQYKLGHYKWQEACADYVLSQYPNSLVGLMWKIISLQFRLKLAAQPHGFPPENQLSKYPELWTLYMDREKFSDKLDGLGYAPYSEQAYKEWMNLLRQYQSILKN